MCSSDLIRIIVFVDTSISHVIGSHMELFNSPIVVITIKSIIVMPYTLHLPTKAIEKSDGSTTIRIL